MVTGALSCTDADVPNNCASAATSSVATSSAAHHFVQTFVLAPQEQKDRFYMLNDIIRFIEPIATGGKIAAVTPAGAGATANGPATAVVVARKVRR